MMKQYDILMNECGVARAHTHAQLRHRHRRDAQNLTQAQTRADAVAGCATNSCEHGGRCVATTLGRLCACAGAWGGARCERYVGHDHACAARACAPPTVCVWDPHPSGAQVRCACLAGALCISPHPPPVLPPPRGAAGSGGGVGAGAAWAGALVVLLAGALAALYILYRRRHGGWSHARLSDNVEINNPMYLAGEDELEPHQHHRTNGGSHFANPVYESMYVPLPQHQNVTGASATSAATEEQANLLNSRATHTTHAPERAALL